MIQNNELAVTTLLERSAQKLQGAKGCLSLGLYDDAVSRAYYCVFHATCAALASLSQSYKTHGRTLGAFNLEFVKSGKLAPKTFEVLQQLFADRQMGDYAVVSTIDKQTATQSVKDAEWFLNECRNYLLTEE